MNTISNNKIINIVEKQTCYIVIVYSKEINCYTFQQKAN